MESASNHHANGVGVYFAIFAALLVLTGVTVWIAFIDLGRANAVVAVLIAAFKATLVLVYFMHLRFSSRLTWLWAGLGFFWLAVLLLFTVADEASRGWLTDGSARCGLRAASFETPPRTAAPQDERMRINRSP